MSGALSGQGISVGLFGGFRALLADFLWLRVNVLWERGELAGTLQTLRLATTVDPRPIVFWVTGARMLAYDMPAWRVTALGGYDVVPAGIRRGIAEEQARLALAWLDDARLIHPESAAILIEQANISLNVRHDLEAAAASYREAAEQPDAPPYAARIHAELLRRLGRKTEALEWLVRLHPHLSPGDQAAAADLVLARIRDLEAELVVPPDRRYQMATP
jgi:tetratricopeptide (TPR) repeat protein